ncbi:MAG: hypothetical protein ABSB76_30950 [Streptosporangiaceae bacterium]|jgi:hypothetical protein
MPNLPADIDGIAKTSIGFIPNPPAPEELVPPLIGEDTSWVATNATRAKGLQPITNTNPNGDYAGVSPMSPAA